MWSSTQGYPKHVTDFLGLHTMTHARIRIFTHTQADYDIVVAVAVVIFEIHFGRQKFEAGKQTPEAIPVACQLVKLSAL